MNFNLQQTSAKSEESKLELSSLRIYFFVWIAWTLVKMMVIVTTIYTNLMLFAFLFLGMINLNHTYLALFAFLNLLPIITTSTTFLDRIFGQKNPFEGSFLINIILFLDLLVSFYGIKVTFRCFQVFKAESLGFEMKGVIDTQESLNSDEEDNSDKPFKGKGVRIGSSEED